MILHVGYPKSASTHLQENVFKQEEFNYLNFNFPGQLYELIYDEENRYTPERAKSLVNSEVFPFINKGKVNIISEERYTFNTVISTDEMAERLYYLFPEARVLIIIRNQFDILRSLYDMHPYSYFENKRKWLSFDDWFSAHQKNYDISFISGLKYDLVIKKYLEIFGVEKVVVVPLEKIIEKHEDALNSLSGLLNISREKFLLYWDKDQQNTAGTHSLYHLKLKYLSFIRFSRFIPKSFLQAISKKFGSDRKTLLSEEQKNRISRLYGDSNHNLQKILKDDLIPLGYPVSQRK